MTMEQKKDKPTQQQVLEAIRAFNDARDWEQFHNPKSAQAVEQSQTGALVPFWRLFDTLEK